MAAVERQEERQLPRTLHRWWRLLGAPHNARQLLEHFRSQLQYIKTRKEAAALSLANANVQTETGTAAKSADWGAVQIGPSLTKFGVK